MGICIELHTSVYMKGVNGTCLNSRDPFPGHYNGTAFKRVPGKSFFFP